MYAFAADFFALTLSPGLIGAMRCRYTGNSAGREVWISLDTVRTRTLAILSLHS
jgi:hypothetical protein